MKKTKETRGKGGQVILEPKKGSKGQPSGKEPDDKKEEVKVDGSTSEPEE